MSYDVADFEAAIRDRLSYDPETGIITWTERAPNKAAGSRAGTVNSGGYISIFMTVEGKRRSFLGHRVAWFLVHGAWPKEQIDHANLDRADNRLSNIREATCHENARNKRGRSRWPKGVRLLPGVNAMRWSAEICIRGKRHRLGTFETMSKAQAAYAKAARRYHKQFARVD